MGYKTFGTIITHEKARNKFKMPIDHCSMPYSILILVLNYDLHVYLNNKQSVTTYGHIKFVFVSAL